MKTCKIHNLPIEDDKHECTECQSSINKFKSKEHFQLLNWQKKNPERWAEIKDVSPRPLGARLRKQLTSQVRKFKRGTIDQILIVCYSDYQVENLRRHMNKYYPTIEYGTKAMNKENK